MSPESPDQAVRKLFELRYGEPAESSSPLRADGSDRKLFRLKGGGRSVVGVVNSDRQENRAFLEFSKHFHKAGLPVPEIFAEDGAAGAYLETDLGDTTLFDLLTQRRTDPSPGLRPPSPSRGEGDASLSQDVLDMYRNVIEALPRFQIEAGRTLDYSVCYPRSSFDMQSMMWDLNYFKYYFLRLAKIPLSEQALEDDFQRFTDFLLQADRGFFLYRDFQSRNVMVVDGRPFFIDYQGGRRGALQYDVASLLFDAKADLPFEVRDELLTRYLEACRKHAKIDPGDFRLYYPGYVYIRIMQAMGAYGLRGFYERKHHFLASIPYAVQNLEWLLRHTELPVELPELFAVFKRLVASSYLRQFGTASLKLTVRIQSFSYKEGVPTDEKGHGGGFVFDCRSLPNPGRFEKYAKLSGRDAEVIAYLEKEPAVRRFLEHVYGLVDATIENYRSRNFTDLQVAFGCTGGQHRSVYCAELLAKRLREKGVQVELRHLAGENGRSAAPSLQQPQASGVSTSADPAP